MAQYGKPRVSDGTLRHQFPVTHSKTHGGEIYSNQIGGGILVRAKAAGLTTTLVDDVLRTYGDDFFNGMAITALKCGSIVFGESKLISDFAELTGILTFAAFSAAVESEDEFIINMPEGAKVGQDIFIHKGTTITPTTGGVVLTGVAVGDVWIESIGLQKITAQAAGITALVLSSDDTKSLSKQLVDASGILLNRDNGNLADGRQHCNLVNWKLASGKALSIASTGANGTADYIWTIKALAITPGASLATA